MTRGLGRREESRGSPGIDVTPGPARDMSSPGVSSSPATILPREDGRSGGFRPPRSRRSVLHSDPPPHRELRDVPAPRRRRPARGPATGAGRRRVPGAAGRSLRGLDGPRAGPGRATLRAAGGVRGGQCCGRRHRHDTHRGHPDGRRSRRRPPHPARRAALRPGQRGRRGPGARDRAHRRPDTDADTGKAPQRSTTVGTTTATAPRTATTTCRPAPTPPPRFAPRTRSTGPTARTPRRRTTTRRRRRRTSRRWTTTPPVPRPRARHRPQRPTRTTPAPATRVTPVTTTRASDQGDDQGDEATTRAGRPGGTGSRRDAAGSDDRPVVATDGPVREHGRGPRPPRRPRPTRAAAP